MYDTKQCFGPYWHLSELNTSFEPNAAEVWMLLDPKLKALITSYCYCEYSK